MRQLDARDEVEPTGTRDFRTRSVELGVRDAGVAVDAGCDRTVDGGTGIALPARPGRGVVLAIRTPGPGPQLRQ
jgi:hypothetical protein